jgi:phosphatidate cytidylyltransferase
VLRARLATSAVVIPLLLALIIYGPYWLFAAVVGILAVLGVAEYAAMAFPTRTGERLLNVLLGTFLVAAIATPEPRAVPAALSATIIVGLIWTLLARRDFEDGLRDFGLSLVGVFYTGLLLPHFIWLRTLDAWQSGWPPRWPLPEGACWVIFVLAIAMAGDAGGYTVGHAIGRHKLAPRVSPGKTIEGSIGIVLASLLAAVVSKLILFQQRSWPEIMALGLVMAILGQLGDLSESIMKRTFNIKESGWLFPGHGGVLDRTDSLLFPVTFLYYYVVFTQ